MCIIAILNLGNAFIINKSYTFCVKLIKQINLKFVIHSFLCFIYIYIFTNYCLSNSYRIPLERVPSTAQSFAFPDSSAQLPSMAILLEYRLRLDCCRSTTTSVHSLVSGPIAVELSKNYYYC